MIILSKTEFSLFIYSHDKYFIYKFKTKGFINSKFSRNTHCIKCNYYNDCLKGNLRKAVNETMIKIEAGLSNAYLSTNPSCLTSKVFHKSLFINSMVRRHHENNKNR